MNILEPLEMVLITPPRMGTRAISDLLMRKGRIIDHAKIDNPHHEGKITRGTLFHTFPACLRNAPNMFNLVEEGVKKELAPLFRERYSYYTWAATMRHPVARYASMVSWHLELEDEGSKKLAKGWIDKPQTCFHMREYESLLNIDKLIHMDYWIRTEHMAEDIMNIPCLKEKILDENNPLPAKAFAETIQNNTYSSSYYKNYFSVNDVPRKTWNYFYFAYKEIYDKFGYEEYRIKER